MKTTAAAIAALVCLILAGCLAAGCRSNGPSARVHIDDITVIPYGIPDNPQDVATAAPALSDDVKAALARAAVKAAIAIIITQTGNNEQRAPKVLEDAFNPSANAAVSAPGSNANADQTTTRQPPAVNPAPAAPTVPAAPAATPTVTTTTEVVAPTE